MTTAATLTHAIHWFEIPVADLDRAQREMPDADHTVLEAECGKGTYVRSLARHLAQRTHRIA